MTTLKDLPENLVVSDQVATRMIDKMLSDSPRVIPPSGPDDQPGVLPVPGQDLPYFFETLSEVFDDYQKRVPKAERDEILLSEEYPPTQLQTETITYRVISRSPGKVSAGRPGPDMSAGARHEWRPRCRYIYDNPEMPNQRTFVMGQYFDNVIEFTCWARTNKVANTRALWLEDLMGIYRFYFKLKGIPEVLFQERLEDITLDQKTGGNSLKGRPMRYLVVTDKTFSVYEPDLRDIVINLGLGAS